MRPQRVRRSSGAQGVERLADLKLAVERRAAELPPLVVRRARAADAHTGLSIIQPAINIRKAGN